MEKKVQEETGLDGSSHPWPAQRQLSFPEPFCLKPTRVSLECNPGSLSPQERNLRSWTKA